MSSDPGSSSRSGSSKQSSAPRIQPGAVVSAFYGPFASAATDSEKRRSRTKLLGTVLSSHSEGNWLIHWFLIGKNAYAPSNKLRVEDEADPVAAQRVEKLLKNNSENYIGGPDKLRGYVDLHVTRGSTPTKKRSTIAGDLQSKRLKDSAVRRLPMSVEKNLITPAAADRQPGKFLGDQSF